jgi:hypothetical protein
MPSAVAAPCRRDCPRCGTRQAIFFDTEPYCLACGDRPRPAPLPHLPRYKGPHPTKRPGGKYG